MAGLNETGGVVCHIAPCRVGEGCCEQVRSVGARIGTCAQGETRLVRATCVQVTIHVGRDGHRMFIVGARFPVVPDRCSIPVEARYNEVLIGATRNDRSGIRGHRALKEPAYVHRSVGAYRHVIAVGAVVEVARSGPQPDGAPAGTAQRGQEPVVVHPGHVPYDPSGERGSIVAAARDVHLTTVHGYAVALYIVASGVVDHPHPDRIAGKAHGGAEQGVGVGRAGAGESGTRTVAPRHHGAGGAAHHIDIGAVRGDALGEDIPVGGSGK